MCGIKRHVERNIPYWVDPAKPVQAFVMDAEEERECQEFAKAETDGKQ